MGFQWVGVDPSGSHGDGQSLCPLGLRSHCVRGVRREAQWGPVSLTLLVPLFLLTALDLSSDEAFPDFALSPVTIRDLSQSPRSWGERHLLLPPLGQSSCWAWVESR